MRMEIGSAAPALDVGDAPDVEDLASDAIKVALLDDSHDDELGSNV